MKRQKRKSPKFDYKKVDYYESLSLPTPQEIENYSKIIKQLSKEFKDSSSLTVLFRKQHLRKGYEIYKEGFERKLKSKTSSKETTLKGTIKEAKAVLECKVEQFIEVQGDHIILVGKVLHAEVDGEGLDTINPLLHDSGKKFRTIGKEVILKRK